MALLLLAPMVRATEYYSAYTNGTTWTYTLVNIDGQTKARLTRRSAGNASIPTSFSGALAIPSELDGHPVAQIGSYAFDSCQSVESVEIPNSVEIIGAYAFKGCTGLDSITIPASVTNIASTSFNGCTGITQVGASQFVCSSDLRTLFKNSYTHIVSVIIGSDVKSISSGAFRKLCALSSFSVASGNDTYIAVDGLLLSKDGKTLVRGINGTVTIPDSVTKIDTYAFYELPNLNAVTIGPNVSETNIHFFDCSGLMSLAVDSRNVVFSSSNQLLLSKDGKQLFCGVNGDVTIPNTVTEISSCAFGGYSNLTSVKIPSSVQKIGQSAFSGCSSLESVSIPDGIKIIYGATFSDCVNLKYVNIPDSVTTIYMGAFDGCVSLVDIKLPASLTSIPAYAFSGCRSLRGIAIPASVGTIYYAAFSGCTSLVSVVFEGNAPTIDIPSSLSSNYEPFYNVASGCTAYVKETAYGFPVAGEMWHGLPVAYIPAKIFAGVGREILLQSDGYFISANDGETLATEDFSFSGVVGGLVVNTSAGYYVSIAADGKSATVQLKEPTFGAAVVAVGSESPTPDGSDPTGTLVAVDASELAAMPVSMDNEEIGALPVAAVPGLYYQAAWGDNLYNLTTGAKVQARTDTLYLGVIKQTGTRGFYKVTVSEQ